jgi:hypothetical protein
MEMGKLKVSWVRLAGVTLGIVASEKDFLRARKRCLPTAHKRAKSLLMNPTQKQFSLNRGASRKQIPISKMCPEFHFFNKPFA